MNRRNFICRVAAVGAGGAGVAAGAAVVKKGVDGRNNGEARETASVTWDVKGFTCITCAVGLEVMLRKQRGVGRADASWPKRNVAIGYDARLTSEKELKGFIADCGFSVA